jgi:hypothetical protein
MVKAYLRHTRKKTVHDWVRSEREYHMASLCGTYKEVRPEDLISTITGQPECQHCKRMADAEAS